MRQLFKPVQPAIHPERDQASYAEQLPSLPLMPYVYCYWQLSSLPALSQPFVYRVVADGCIDLFFHTRQPEAMYVMGFSTTYTEFPLDNPFNYIGVRFLPAAFPSLFRVDAASLTDRFEPLDAVVPALASGLTSVVAGLHDLSELSPVLDQYLTTILAQKTPATDNRLLHALDLILHAGGNLRLERDLQAGVSPRQLRRLFDFYIGDTPKTFSKVVRFQQLLHTIPTADSLRAGKTFYDAGYYDQAHFIKEFKTMYGLPPTIALP
ncbi:AraC family transcriptional regulator [Chitinophaga qingshengii]|uniref:AraC family transcriptional regulator n=1 Tax=Chitinophaga qingshengii TaxID=1569794 RepID=A0ABR7TTL1_9BACT|nr:helix-turn-helix domain-containing protein [Chitinophaga qingshengii]MBC9932995.1 AraC family transcriptional regulator [Chitinophaga qingshengii]